MEGLWFGWCGPAPPRALTPGSSPGQALTLSRRAGAGIGGWLRWGWLLFGWLLVALRWWRRMVVWLGWARASPCPHPSIETIAKPSLQIANCF